MNYNIKSTDIVTDNCNMSYAKYEKRRKRYHSLFL